MIRDSSWRTERADALATLRWVLGGEPVAPETFLAGFPALPRSLRPLAADAALSTALPLPPDARARLTMLQRDAAIFLTARRTASRKVRSVLDDAGIPMVFLKGAALAEQVYPRPIARPSSDIDLWVPGEHHPRAVAVLADAGIVGCARHRDRERLERAAPETILEMSLGGAPVIIEIHARPASLSTLDEDAVSHIWASLVPVGPDRIPAMPLDLQLLHVSVHIARRHGFVNGLKALVDIHMITRVWPSEPLWDSLVSRARAWRVEDATYLSLAATRSLLDSPIPDRALQSLDAGAAPALVEEACNLAWMDEPNIGLGIIGGGELERGWLRNRLLLRTHLTAEQRRRLPSSEKPSPARVVGYWMRRLTMIGGLALRGELFKAAYWRRVSVVLRRVRFLRRLSSDKGALGSDA